MLLKLGILGGRAHHHTSFLGLLKFCDLLHIWNTSWMLKSRKCERNNSGWITVVFQVLVSDLGKCGLLGLGRVKNSVSTKLNGQWFLRFCKHSVFLEKNNLCSAQSSKLVSHVTTSILFVEHNLMKSSPFFCVGDAGQFSFILVDSGTVLVGAIFVRVPQHFLVVFCQCLQLAGALASVYFRLLMLLKNVCSFISTPNFQVCLSLANML